MMRISPVWRPIGLVACLVASVGCATVVTKPVSRSGEVELKLRRGPFAGFAGTELDDPVEFSNDIYGATCHPLYLVTGGTGSKRSTGRILLWLSRAHVFDGRVFVSTCDVAAPMEVSTAHARVLGSVSDWGFEAEQILGQVDVAESDMGWGVPQAIWDGACTSATFRLQSHQRTIRIPSAR